MAESCLPARSGVRLGRKRTSFTAETVETILAALEKAVPVKHALALARVTQNTWEQWLKTGEWDLRNTPEGEDLSLYAIFYEEVQIAKAKAVENLIDKMDAALVRDGRNWQALFSIYDRLHSEEFGQKQAIAIQQDTTVKVIVKYQGGDDWRQGKAIATEHADEVIDEVLTDQKLIGGESFE